MIYSEIVDDLRVEVITCRKECKKEELHHRITSLGHRVPAFISDPFKNGLFLSVLKLTEMSIICFSFLTSFQKKKSTSLKCLQCL